MSELSHYDAAGRAVARPLDASLPAGAHELVLAAVDDAGRRLPAGVYFVRLESAGRAETRRLVFSR